MTEIAYKKMRMERRKKSRDLLERAKAFDAYPPDLHYFWEYMQDKRIGLPYCLGMIYNLGFADGRAGAAE